MVFDKYTIQDMGINAPKAHQRVIRKLTKSLAILFDEGKIILEPFPETMIDESKSSAVPDILLFDNKNEQTKVIIEVTHSTGVADDFDKVIYLINERNYGVEEGFVYNYKTAIWLKYKKGVGKIEIDPSFCESINYDLNDLL